jgi:hypothetical protein
MAFVATPYPTRQHFMDLYSRLFLCDEPLNLEGTPYDPETSILEGYKYIRYLQNHVEDIAAERRDGLDMITLAHNDELGWRYEYKMAEGVTGRKFCATSKTYLGWVPPTAETGDIVYVVFGAKVPFILRERGSSFYRLTGECYVHGIMEGEAMDKGDLVEQRFRII